MSENSSTEMIRDARCVRGYIPCSMIHHLLLIVNPSCETHIITQNHKGTANCLLTYYANGQGQVITNQPYIFFYNYYSGMMSEYIKEKLYFFSPSIYR